MGATGFAGVLCALLTVYGWVLLAHVLLSWASLFGAPMSSGVLRAVSDAIDALVRPVLAPLRSMIPPVRAGGVGIDLSVIVAFVVLQVLTNVLC
ncbi:MAG: YggT family protein [Actinomycetota bacterium]